MAGIDVVGMTARGWVDLPEPERQLIAEADVLVGARRHLDQVDERLGQRRMTWPSPLRPKLADFMSGLTVAGWLRSPAVIRPCRGSAAP